MPDAFAERRPRGPDQEDTSDGSEIVSPARAGEKVRE
jgi:hypothetical protein